MGETEDSASREPTTGRQILTHGATGWKRGCRCDVCDAANGPRGVSRGVKRARLQDEDRRTERASVPLSPRELALVDRARGDVPRGQYMRMLVVEGAANALGIDPEDADTAVRGGEGRRQRNYGERQPEDGG